MFNPEQKAESQFLAKQALVKLYAKEGDILQWGKILFPDKFNLPFCKELHEYFIEIAHEPFTDTLAPRGHAKSAIKCFLIPLFIALNEPERYKHYLNIQKTSSKAVTVNLNIRTELELNELLIAVYGDQRTDKWTEKQFVLKNGVIFSALGAGDSIRGIQVSNKRPDYIILDDIYDDDEANNVERIEKLNSWFWASVFKAVPLSGNKCIHIQGTAVNKFDLLHTLSTRKRWKFKKFQAVIDDVNKIVLWPEAVSYDQLMADKEDMGTAIFEREMQNNCRDTETQLIKDHWIHYYDDTTNGKRVGVYAGVDPSIGSKDTSDYTGLAVIYVTEVEDSYNYYIHDICNEHLSQKARIDLVNNKHTQHNFTKAFVEGISGFQDFCNELIRVTSVPVKMITSVKDKITNLENNSSKFENGKVFINKAIPIRLRNELVYQLTTNNPKHDDIRDAVLIVLNGINQKTEIDTSAFVTDDNVLEKYKDI